MGVRRHRNLLLTVVTAVTFLLLASQLGALERVTSSNRGFDYEERLGGPGSSPPTCRAKCGRCYPCKPVHVPIQPGLSMPLEYYPEAWRCKCGNKLFMP